MKKKIYFLIKFSKESGKLINIERLMMSKWDIWTSSSVLREDKVTVYQEHKMSIMMLKLNRNLCTHLKKYLKSKHSFQKLVESLGNLASWKADSYKSMNC